MPVEIPVELTEVQTQSPESAHNGDWLLENFFALTDACNSWTARNTKHLDRLNLQNVSLPEMELDLLEKVEETVLLEDQYDVPVVPYTEKPIQIAALINFLASYKVLRKDHSPYTAHPMFVDIIILFLSGLPPEELTIVRITALIHDVVEEDTLRLLEKHIQDPNAGCIPSNFDLSTTENMLMAKNILNSIMPELQIGTAALELMQAVIEDEDESVTDEYKHARFIHWLNWRAQRRSDLRVVKLADKIHDLLDLDYITKNPEKSKKEIDDKLASKLAKVSFSMYSLMKQEDGSLHPDVPPQLWNIFVYILRSRIYSFDIDLSDEGIFKKTLASYQEPFETHKEKMLAECADYAQKVELWH